jgi:hypothetical protein
MSEVPIRIQRRRTKGWRMPENTIYVGRGSKWGNPHTLENSGSVSPVLRFACETAPLYPKGHIEKLRGKNLACWCPLDRVCHADVLLEIANEDVLK